MTDNIISCFKIICTYSFERSLNNEKYFSVRRTPKVSLVGVVFRAECLFSCIGAGKF